jgi:hypothetical protein
LHPLEGRAMTSGSETRQRHHVARLRLTDAEQVELAARAERAGLTVGAYLRQQALGGSGPRARRRPHADAALLLDVLGQVGRIGSNVNQLARAANAGGWPSASAMEDAAQDVIVACDAIMQALGKGGGG